MAVHSLNTWFTSISKFSSVRSQFCFCSILPCSPLTFLILPPLVSRAIINSMQPLYEIVSRYPNLVYTPCLCFSIIRHYLNFFHPLQLHDRKEPALKKMNIKKSVYFRLRTFNLVPRDQAKGKIFSWTILCYFQKKIKFVLGQNLWLPFVSTFSKQKFGRYFLTNFFFENNNFFKMNSKLKEPRKTFKGKSKMCPLEGPERHKGCDIVIFA